MSDILGRYDANRLHCDGFSRRGFLKVGGMAAGGLSLSQLLAIEAQASIRSSSKALIKSQRDGEPKMIRNFLVACCLAEAGARGLTQLQPTAAGIEILARGQRFTLGTLTAAQEILWT